MDELTAVAEMRRNTPAPTAAATAAARARLNAAMTPRLPRIAWRWRLAGAAALSLTVAGGVVSAVNLGGREAEPIRPVAVTELLETAARSAAAQPFVPPRADQFAFQDQIIVDLDTREQARSWQSVGDPGRAPQVCSRHVTQPAAEFDCHRPPAVTPPGGNGAKLTSYGYLKGLPRDPDRLLTELRASIPAGSGEPESAVLADRLTAVLASPLAPPDLRAAALKAITRMPGVTRTDHATDAAGRTGTAATWTVDGIRNELIFRTDGSEYLGYRMVLTGAGRYADLAGRPAGTVVHSTALLGSGIVDRARELP